MNADVGLHIDRHGAAAVVVRLVFPSSRAYREARDRHPDPAELLRLDPDSGGAAVRWSAARFDDDARAVEARADCRGLAARRGGRWEAPLGIDGEPAHLEDGLAVLYHNVPESPSLVKAIAVTVVLPPGAFETTYDRNVGTLFYRLPPADAMEDDAETVAEEDAAAGADIDASNPAVAAALSALAGIAPPGEGIMPPDADEPPGANGRPEPGLRPPSPDAPELALSGAERARPDFSGTWILDAVTANAGGGYIMEIDIAAGDSPEPGRLVFAETGDVIPLGAVTADGNTLRIESNYATHADRRELRIWGGVEGDAWTGEFVLATDEGRRIAAGPFVARRTGHGGAVPPAWTPVPPPPPAPSSPPPEAPAVAPEESLPGWWEGTYVIKDVARRFSLDITLRGGVLTGVMRLTDENLDGMITDVWLANGRAQVVAYFKNLGPDGGEHILVVAMDGAVAGKRWSGLFAAGPLGAAEPVLVCDFELARTAAPLPRPRTPPPESDFSRPGAAAAPEENPDGEARAAAGDWEGTYGLIGVERRVNFAIRFRDGDAEDPGAASGQVVMPDDAVVAEIARVERAGDQLILSAAWPVEGAGERAMAVFSGRRRLDDWRGDMAVYIGGARQPLFTGKFAAMRR